MIDGGIGLRDKFSVIVDTETGTGTETDTGTETGTGTGEGEESGDDPTPTPTPTPTPIVPIANRAISVPSILDFYTDEELNTDYHAKTEYEHAIDNYGAIYKVVSFSETSDVEKLKEYGREWIRRNYYDGVLSFSVKAVDLHLLGYNVDKLLAGDRIPVRFINDRNKTQVIKTLTCLSAKYDLLDPKNSTFTIGIPGVSDNIKYREAIGVSVKNSKKTGTFLDRLGSALEGVKALMTADKEKLQEELQKQGIDVDLNQ